MNQGCIEVFPRARNVQCPKYYNMQNILSKRRKKTCAVFSQKLPQKLLDRFLRMKNSKSSLEMSVVVKVVHIFIFM